MRTMRLAWFSPLPPARTGLSVHSRELLCRLPPEYGIDVFVDDPVAEEARRLNRFSERVVIYPAHDFMWRRNRTPYDLTVYPEVPERRRVDRTAHQGA